MVSYKSVLGGYLEDTQARIEKDIAMFYENDIKMYYITEEAENSKRINHVIDLSVMYAKDAKSYLDKGDLFTAFASISYAHGLIDSVKEIFFSKDA